MRMIAVSMLLAMPVQEKGLQIHWIYVEGGAATLVVTPRTVPDGRGVDRNECVVELRSVDAPELQIVRVGLGGAGDGFNIIQGIFALDFGNHLNGRAFLSQIGL